MQEIVQDKQVVELQQNTTNIATKVDTLLVVDERSSKYATDLLSFIKKAYRAVETRRKFFSQPLTETVKEYNNYFKAISDPLKKYESVVKDKILSYVQKCRAEQNEAIRLKQEQADELAKETGLPQVETVKPPEVKTQVQGSMGKSYIQKIWTYEITDISLVPKNYIAIERVLVNNAIRAGAREIPGLRIFQKETIGNR